MLPTERQSQFTPDAVDISVDIDLTALPQTLRRRLDPPRKTDSFFSWHYFQKSAFNVYLFGGVLGFLGLFTRKVHCLFPVTISRLT